MQPPLVRCAAGTPSTSGRRMSPGVRAAAVGGRTSRRPTTTTPAPLTSSPALADTRRPCPALLAAPPIPRLDLPSTSLPRHVAIILDGNRRWARARGLPERAGHAAGVGALRTVVAACVAWGIPALTVFGFSTENYRRGGAGAASVLSVARSAALTHAPALADAGVRLRFIPPSLARPRSLVAALRAGEALTDAALGGGTPALHLTVALSYGGRADIGAAAAAIAADAAAGKLDPGAVTAETVAARLSTATVLPADLANPDLIIRSAGERRLSNFLLFEAAYAELAFTDVLWPDFGVRELEGVLREFAGRRRRFGGD